ncbi:Uncharacterised protein [Mycobacteroides abscessus subsp. abscessus]|nr:Uncharacterised protein [Mycobacteroides abscessus subsp. abscessus]
MRKLLGTKILNCCHRQRARSRSTLPAMCFPITGLMPLLPSVRVVGLPPTVVPRDGSLCKSRRLFRLCLLSPQPAPR